MAAHEGDWKRGMCPEDGAGPPNDLPAPGWLKGKEERGQCCSVRIPRGLVRLPFKDRKLRG